MATRKGVFKKRKRGLFTEPAPNQDAIKRLCFQLAKNRILESLARDDLDDLLGLDLDRLAGGGIAARASRTLDELDFADAGKHIALLFLLGTLDSEIDETLVDGDGLLLANLTGFREGSHDSALSGRYDFFLALSHFFDP